MTVQPPTPEQVGFIHDVADQFASSFDGVSADDIKQQLYLLWYERWDSIRGYVEHEDPVQGRALLYRTLQNWTIGYCKREVSAMTGARPDDIYYYSRSQLTEMLPFVEEPAVWSNLAVSGEKDGRSKKVASMGNDVLAHYADLTAAWQRLTPSQRDLLRARFPYSGDPVPYDELAEDLGLSSVNIRQQVTRAVTNLQKYMGGRQRRRGLRAEVQERRRAISNAQAQVMTREAFDGD